VNRVAAALLKMAVDFGLLRGSVVKEFVSYPLSERSFLYLLYAIREEMHSPRKVLESEDWRMFLMTPADVERELLLLHQYRKLDYHVAGSIVELTLPCANACEYAERMVA
jgi:DNA-binding transcriptional regulator PaaX